MRGAAGEMISAAGTTILRGCCGFTRLSECMLKRPHTTPLPAASLAPRATLARGAPATPPPGGNSSAACLFCAAGAFTKKAGAISCETCPGGHCCPLGKASAPLNCGRGNYCTDGSPAPLPCPLQVPPRRRVGHAAGAGARVPHCRNHCFWNFSSGDGKLSACLFKAAAGLL